MDGWVHTHIDIDVWMDIDMNIQITEMFSWIKMNGWINT